MIALLKLTNLTESMMQWCIYLMLHSISRVAWQNEGGNIEVALWGKNLLDEENASNPGGFVADVLGAAHTAIDDPLTYGVDLRYMF
jgi:hypothetical protein